MEEVSLFVLVIIFGGFLLFFVIMCCIRLFVFLADDKRFLCFKSKAALRRRRIQLALLPEVNNFQRPENLGYTAAPDETITEYTICQPYVYEDGRSTGMRMIANLPIALAFTTHSGIPMDSIFGIYPPYPISPNLSQNLELHNREHYQELPPPNYIEAHLHLNEKLDEGLTDNDLPPPSYDECMKLPRSSLNTDNENVEQCQLPPDSATLILSN